MALNWSSVRAEHVQKACDIVRAENKSAKSSGLYVVIEHDRFPAKKVVKLAHCFANSLPVDSQLKFSSGDGTMKLLNRLGFTTERIGQSRGSNE